MHRHAATAEGAALIALVSAVLLAWPAGASACPELAPTPLGAVFTADGAVLRTADSIIDLRGAEPVTAPHPGLGGALAALSPDGSLLVTMTAVHVAAEGVPPCATTHLWVRVGPATAPELPRLARLASTGGGTIRFSPSGRFVALGLRDAEGEPRVHLFDLRRRRRLHVLEGVAVTFLDDRLFLLRDARARISLYGVSDGERRQVLAPPARRLRPFAEGAAEAGFFATARMGDATRFVRVHLAEGRVRLEPLGPPLTDRPLSISHDGARGAWLIDGRPVVRDLRTGDEIPVETESDAPPARAAVLSPDGAILAVISDGRGRELALPAP